MSNHENQAVKILRVQRDAGRTELALLVDQETQLLDELAPIQVRKDEIHSALADINAALEQLTGSPEESDV